VGTKEQVKALRELVDERDRLYKERDESRKTAVDAALQAAKEKTTDAFVASEKAIVKAEDAQREYNARSNEFRGQLDDQAKTLLPRFEADSKFRAQEDKLEGLRKEVQSLRESRSETSGGRQVQSEQRTQVNFDRTIQVAVIVAAASAAVAYITYHH
jgi:hypothetical protein